MSERAEVCEQMLSNELDWIERRWGSEFAAHVAWHYAEWGHLEAAEIWAGICWGIIGRVGPQTLDQVAAEEDENRVEYAEYQAQTALGHGF